MKGISQMCQVKRTWNWKAAVKLAVAGLLLSFTFRMLFDGLDIPGYEQAEQELLRGNLWVQAFLLIVVSPVLEELFFRYFLYGKLKERMSIWLAAFLSALSFGLYHGNLAQGVYACLMGMVFVWEMERYGTLKAPIVMHAAANVIGVVLGSLP